jgi:gamma-glutamylcyclotransferase (GGCT)/AIG2-like uncharacterized protein YtfP
MHLRFSLSAFAALWTAGTLFAQDQVTVAPGTAKVLIENEYVRVVESKYAPGVALPMHSHVHGVVVFLSETKAEVLDALETDPAKKRREIVTKPDTAAWTEPQKHEVKNLGPQPVYEIRVEIKAEKAPVNIRVANPELDPIRVTRTMKLLVDNAYVRVIDNVVPIGGNEPMHAHPHGVVVFLADYETESMTPEGITTKNVRKRGQVTWTEPLVHEQKYPGETPGHAIRIELKY